MSDYTEHLISMAGGDGEPVDQLAAIEARANDPFGTSMQGIGQVDADRDTLLALVRTQQARIDAVLELASTRSRCGWQISADEVRKAVKG